jgi:hypothetical protein
MYYITNNVGLTDLNFNTKNRYVKKMPRKGNSARNCLEIMKTVEKI